ncbi:GxxExxY protein [Botrimarina mediterranea]|uniref:GxxExxY protein n=1 Tax=Botrimarina mediterranea TaxID=2528022 RepID=UPI0018D4C89F|nr:GxxExxY protein [Botrimarina mediterranea]
MHEPSEAADRLAKQIWESALEVHRVLGAGFLESVYERALEVELSARGIEFARQHPVALTYKGVPVGDARLDFLIGGLVVVELKSVDLLHAIHHAQVLNYLRATSLELGLLINFNVPLLKDGFKRIVLT